MRKKRQIQVTENSKGVLRTGRRLGLTLPLERDYQRAGEYSAGNLSSFTLGDMFLSLEDDSEEEMTPSSLPSVEDSYHSETFRNSSIEREDTVDDICPICNRDCVCNNTSHKRIQDFSIPKGLEQKKYPRLQSHRGKIVSSIHNHKNNIDNSSTAALDGDFSADSHISTMSCEVLNQLLVSSNLKLNKKNQKESLSSFVTNFHDSTDIKNLSNISKEVEKINHQKISKKNLHDHNSSDLDFYDDDGIFHFDKDDSPSVLSFKELNEEDEKERFNMDEWKIGGTRSKIIKEKNSQACYMNSRDLYTSSYSDDKEDLFWVGDSQNDNSFKSLFKTQTYQGNNSSDDIWSFYSSSFVSKTSETNDVTGTNKILDDLFFKNDFNTLNENGDTTDEDQNFIIKKINQKKEIEMSNDASEKNHIHFPETCNTLTSYDSKTSNLTEKEHLKLNTNSTVTSFEDSKNATSNTINKPPVLGTWVRDLKRPMAIIDGISTNIINPVTSSCTVLSPVSANLSPSSIPSLEDILDTSAFVQLSSSQSSSSSSITNNYLSDFYRWERIPIGTFRRHQQRFTNTREERIKGEWYALTSKSKRQRSHVPILGTIVHHKKNKSRKHKHTNKLKNRIDLFEEVEEIGREQCGLGLGPQLSPLFNGLS